MKLSPLVKQLYVGIPPLLASISVGAALCYPSVLLHQLQANGTSIKIDFETASWMGSIHGLAGVPTIFMPILMQKLGRKFTFIIASTIIIIGWILAYTASNSTTILVSESFHGFGTSSLLAVSCLTITEMMSPKYRDTFIQIFFILYSVGTILIGMLSQYCDYRTISLVMLLPMLISLLVAFTLPESPYWLAYRGEFSKCKKNFIWLRGTDAESTKELNDITEDIIKKAKLTSKHTMSLKYLRQKITSRNFWMPAMHICVLQFLIQGSGSVVTLIYSIEMLKKTIGNDDLALLGGLIMNSLFCVGVGISVIIDRYFNTKPVLLWSVLGVVVFLSLSSVFSYLQTIGLWPKESLVGMYFLAGFMFMASVGIICTAYSMAAALMPVEHRGLGGVLLCINTNLYHAIALKSAPYMFLHINMWGTYLVYSAISMICGLIIWKYVPEIKGRTLQEIDNFYLNGSYSRNSNDDKNEDNTTPLKNLVQ